jgi:hypothetical protein
MNAGLTVADAPAPVISASANLAFPQAANGPYRLASVSSDTRSEFMLAAM